MALSIKNVETELLIRKVARLTGETMTEAVTVALRERLERVVAMERPGSMAADLLRIGTELWDGLDDQSPITKAEFDDLTEDGGLRPEDSHAA